MRILVVEDDPSVAQILKILLVNHGYAVEVATDGQMGLNLAEAFEYDLILLDILLPKLDGIALCKQLRAKGYQMPILLLTGQGGSNEKVAGLDTGADDYVVKPFDQEELIARVRALLRRGHISSQPVLEWGELRLDPSSREVAYASHALALTPKEYGLLEMFLRNPRLTFSLGMILEHLWTFEEAPGEDAVRVHIKTLRQKLKAVGAPIDFIETVYGVGYRLNPLLNSSKSNLSSLPVSTPDIEQPIIEQPAPLRATSNSALSDLAGSASSVAPQPSETESSPASLNSAKDSAILPSPPVPSVLIVQPNVQIRSTLRMLLEREGVLVTLFDQGQNLQEMLAEKAFDLLILGVEVPDTLDLDGYAQCQLLRQDDRWRTLPILLITPQSDPDTVQRVFAAGANDFVSQPIEGSELIARMKIHLEAALLRQKIAALEPRTAFETPHHSSTEDAQTANNRSQPFSFPPILRSSHNI